MGSSYSLNRSLFLLHSISAFFAVIATCMAICEGGVYTAMLAPIFGTLTIAYHIISLTLMCTTDRLDAPLPIAFTVLAYILSLGWLSAFITMTLLLSSHVTGITVFGACRLVLPLGLTTSRKCQMILDPLECVLMLDLAIRSTILRYQDNEVEISRDLEHAGDVAEVARSFGSHILVTRTIQCQYQ